MIFAFLFWFGLVILFHSYFGYALIASVLLRLKKRNSSGDLASNYPRIPVALIIPAFNEINLIEKKIKNCLELDYDQDNLTLIFVTDGSDDGTAETVARYPGVIHFHQPERKGKAAAMNRVMATVTQPLVIFSDANTFLRPSAVNELVKHYADPIVGGVSGEKKILSAGSGAADAGEGFYWKYESLLKKIDSSFYSVVGAAGELFSVRSSLYEPIPEDIIIEDFFLSLKICLHGFVIRYEPAAFAMEAPSINMTEEKKRKVRIAAGGFQAMGRLLPLFNVFRYPSLSYLYISHRVLRWTICPWLLPMIFLANFFLCRYPDSNFYRICFGFQLFFYLLALIGTILSERKISIRVFFLPYYFTFMNLNMIKGLFHYLFLKPSVLWEKSVRS